MDTFDPIPVPEDDKSRMRRWPVETELQDLPAPTFAELVYDLSAKVMALITLGIEGKQFTEQEFHQTKTYCERMLDEERTKLRDQRDRLVTSALSERLEMIRELLVRRYTSKHSHAKLDVFRDKFEGTSTIGTICIRIIDPDFAGTPDPSNHSRFGGLAEIVRNWCEEKNEDYCLCLITPEERPGSVISAEFDNKIEAMSKPASG